MARALATWLFFLPLPLPLLITMCDSRSSGLDIIDEPREAGPSTDAATGDDADDGDAEAAATDAGACQLSTLPLFVDTANGHPSSLHVPVTYKNSPAAFLLDTGSGLTFLQEPVTGPDPVEDAGSVQLGCETRELIGRAEVALDPSHGLPTVGSLGVDALLLGPSQIDFVGSQLLFHAPGVPFTEAAAWPNAPFDLVKGMVLPQVTLGGQPVRLMFDTGADNVLWIGQQPEPGDVETDSRDAVGNIVKLYLGTADLAIGSWHGTVPVLRAPSFPYFEGTVTALGGNIAGLLGLSAMGKHAIIDIDAHVVRVDVP